jgi:hypothetical protein
MDECKSEPQIEERIALAMTTHGCLISAFSPSCENATSAPVARPMLFPLLPTSLGRFLGLICELNPRGRVIAGFLPSPYFAINAS